RGSRECARDDARPREGDQHVLPAAQSKRDQPSARGVSRSRRAARYPYGISEAARAPQSLVTPPLFESYENSMPSRHLPLRPRHILLRHTLSACLLAAMIPVAWSLGDAPAPTPAAGAPGAGAQASATDQARVLYNYGV